MLAQRHVETIIVGGGPAGSTCAWQLERKNRDVLVLEKADFPREKLCAGWITSKVLCDLEFTREDYPHSFMDADIECHIAGLPFLRTGLSTAGENYSIRRYEFDKWLLERSKAEVIKHTVKEIVVDGNCYIIDGLYSCNNLIGAGGTACPVGREIFPRTRKNFRQIVTLEKEFKYPQRQNKCHLYFGQYGKKGYAWYFPKDDGYLNIGLGGKANYFKKADENIHQTFARFLSDLVEANHLDAKTANDLERSGHPYYLNSEHGAIKKDRCFLIGDAAGLATVDLGEGIGPAIESALAVAGEIMGTAVYSKKDLTHLSTAGIVGYLAKKFIAPKALVS